MSGVAPDPEWTTDFPSYACLRQAVFRWPDEGSELVVYEDAATLTAFVEPRPTWEPGPVAGFPAYEALVRYLSACTFPPMWRRLYGPAGPLYQILLPAHSSGRDPYETWSFEEAVEPDDSQDYF